MKRRVSRKAKKSSINRGQHKTNKLLGDETLKLMLMTIVLFIIVLIIRYSLMMQTYATR